VKLYDILKEIQGKPKALILAGAPGAGKSSIIRDILSQFNLKVLNVDDFYVQDLIRRGVSLDMKNATPEERSQQAKAMGLSKKQYDAALDTAVDANESIVVDGTGASATSTLNLNKKLKEAGYDTMMLYVYTSLEQSLERNEKRFEKSQGKDRSLPPAIVFGTWARVTGNFNIYFNEFGKDFVAVVNDPTPFTEKSVEDIIVKYLDPFKPTDTKPKTPAQQASSDKRKAKTNKLVANFLQKDQVQNVIDNSVTKEEAQSKIKAFLSL
jgi:predicted ABC-type ATPase